MPLNSSKQFAFLTLCLFSLSYAFESVAATALDRTKAVQSSKDQLDNAVLTEWGDGNKLRKSSNYDPESRVIDDVKFHCF